MEAAAHRVGHRLDIDVAVGGGGQLVTRLPLVLRLTLRRHVAPLRHLLTRQSAVLCAPLRLGGVEELELCPQLRGTDGRRWVRGRMLGAG